MLRINNHKIGVGEKVFVIAEIGINHNGDIEIAKQLMKSCKEIGCDAVKFQKRTLSVVYTQQELDAPRETPFGKTNYDLKKALEFEKKEFDEIDKYAKKLNLIWFASCWDLQSIDFIEGYNPPCHKIASAMLTRDDILKKTKETNKPIILSTGMSTLEEIDKAVSILDRHNLSILHCTSTYPSKNNELNLKCIPAFIEKYKIPIGYSGHELGIQTSLAAVALGAAIVERHVTLDRSMFGSDQSASLEIPGFEKLIRDIRVIESAMGDGLKKVYDSELPILKKLRR